MDLVAEALVQLQKLTETPRQLSLKRTGFPSTQRGLPTHPRSLPRAGRLRSLTTGEPRGQWPQVPHHFMPCRSWVCPDPVLSPTQLPESHVAACEAQVPLENSPVTCNEG